MKLFTRVPKLPTVPTAHNILDRFVRHHVITNQDPLEAFIVYGKVIHTTVHPISGAILIEFSDGTSTIYNPKHEEAPIKGRLSETLEILR